MKQNYDVFTRRWLGLDTRVWITFFTGAILSAALLSFSLITTVPCIPFNIASTTSKGVSRSLYYVGETVVFTSNSTAPQMIWDFGDHQQSAGSRVEHHFAAAGQYQVVATAGRHCTQAITISIQTLDLTKPVAVVNIDGPDAPEVSEKAEYTFPVKATHYEWTVLNSPNFGIQIKEKAVFNFPTPGTRIIELRLDNDPQKVYRKTVDVLPSDAPPPIVRSPTIVVPHVAAKPKTAAPLTGTQPQSTTPVQQNTSPVVTVAENHKGTGVTDDKLKSMMDQLVAGSLNEQGLSEGLCNGTATRTVINGKQKSLDELCSLIQGKKKIRIKSVTTERDSKGCVTTLHVEYKHKGLF